LYNMLASGIIQESNSPMASSLVCVLKEKGGCDGIRLAVDCRYLNSYTVGDAFPVPDIEDVIQKVGGKKYISTFDCRQGYYQTDVRDKDRCLTALVCMFARIRSDPVRTEKCRSDVCASYARHFATDSRLYRLVCRRLCRVL